MTPQQQREAIEKKLHFWMDELRDQLGDNDEAHNALDRIEDALQELDIHVMDEYESAISTIQEVLKHDLPTAS